MEPYIVTTGALFALLAFGHLVRTAVEWPRLSADPWFVVEGPAIGVLAAAVATWAWRLLRAPVRVL